MYDGTACFYDFFAPKSTDAFLKSAFVHQLCRPEARLLDLGAGTGKVAINLAQKGHRVFCVETSPSMQSVFLTKLNGLNLDSQISLYPLDISQLQLSAPVDLAFAFDFFLLLRSDEERSRTLGKIAAMICSGGKFVANFVPANPARANRPLSESSRRSIGDIEYIHRIASEQIEPSMRKVTWVFESLYRQAPLSKFTEDFVIRQDTIEALEPMLKRHGFIIENVYGGFQMEPYTGNEPSLVIQARKEG